MTVSRKNMKLRCLVVGRNLDMIIIIDLWEVLFKHWSMGCCEVWVTSSGNYIPKYTHTYWNQVLCSMNEMQGVAILIMLTKPITQRLDDSAVSCETLE